MTFTIFIVQNCAKNIILTSLSENLALCTIKTEPWVQQLWSTNSTKKLKKSTLFSKHLCWFFFFESKATILLQTAKQNSILLRDISMRKKIRPCKFSYVQALFKPSWDFSFFEPNFQEIFSNWWSEFYFVRLWYWTLNVFSLKLFLLFTIKIGCESSIESYEIYKHCEEKHARLVNIVCKIGFIFLAVIFGASMSLPICSALFGYPSPNAWFFPIPSK